jgi:hypothetical protein
VDVACPARDELDAGINGFTPAGFAGVQWRAFCTPLRSLKQRRINMKIKTKVRGGSLDRGC